jgi:cob(I)alamin adenosyltransferase
MSKKWKIYTKTGDKGETSLIGGTRVPKYHDRIEAYGTVDELNSYIGLIRDHKIQENLKKTLCSIQECLFVIESSLATDSSVVIERKLPQIKDTDIQFLETEIDQMNELLPTLTNFILPGGNILSSHCHIARTVCRRAERVTLKLSKTTKVETLDLKYLNRLSDYLFVLARKFVYDLNDQELEWKP